MSGIYGADVSSAVSEEQWRALKEDRSAQFAIVRCYQSTGRPDQNAPATIKNAWQAGMQWVDVYHFPTLRVEAAKQVNDSVDALDEAAAKLVRYWLDVETAGSGWSKTSLEENVAFLQALAEAATARGLTVGIYTGWGPWPTIMGTSTAFSQYPLWYAHYDSVHSFSDFRSFGGWDKPTMKQFKGDESYRSISYDGNWCPAALPGEQA